MKKKNEFLFDNWNLILKLYLKGKKNSAAYIKDLRAINLKAL